MFSQLHYGGAGKQYTNYEAMRQGLEHIKTIAKTFDCKVAIPYNIGCGFGGGDWYIVNNIIHEVFSGKKNESIVKLYKYAL